MVSVLIHPTPAARLSAAWCLRSIAVALPSQMTILIERCMNRMHHLKSSPEAISGYSFALAALLGGVRYTSLGIPHAKGKVSCKLPMHLENGRGSPVCKKAFERHRTFVFFAEHLIKFNCRPLQDILKI